MSGKKVQQPQPPIHPKQSPPTPSSTNQAKNPTGQLVPLPPSSIANRYLVSTIPKPNYERPSLGQPSYSFTLVSPAPNAITTYIIEEPFGPIQYQKPSSSSSRKGRSPYLKKPFVQHISHLVHIKDPLVLTMEVLPAEWHFLPKHPEKNIKFYKSPHPGKVCSNSKCHEQKGPLSSPLPQVHNHKVCQLQELGTTSLVTQVAHKSQVSHRFRTLL